MPHATHFMPPPAGPRATRPGSGIIQNIGIYTRREQDLRRQEQQDQLRQSEAQQQSAAASSGPSSAANPVPGAPHDSRAADLEAEIAAAAKQKDDLERLNPYAQQRESDAQKVQDLIDESLVQSETDDDDDDGGDFPPLTEDQYEQIENAWDPEQSPHDIISQIANIDLKRPDLQTLEGSEWLNDNVINCYLGLLRSRNDENISNGGGLPKVWITNTFFYSALKTDGYKKVRRWCKKCKPNIFAMDKFIVPVHLGMHWCCGVVDFTTKTIQMYDSLGVSEHQFFVEMR